MNSTIDYEADVIDSRDIINRIAALRKIKEDGQELSDDDEWELSDLLRVESECQGYGDWEYGESLIKDEYFTTHVSEIIEECYDLATIDFATWPFNCVTMDWELAAERAKVDYDQVIIHSHTYLIHR